MTPILTTKRLTLRPVQDSDADAITAGLNHPDVPGWLTNVPYPYTLADAHYYIRHIAQDPDDHHWVLDAGAGLIGVISCRSDMGYWLDAAHHGNGYMTEAAETVVAYCFEASDQDLTSGYHLGNKASCNVLTKLGFQNTHQGEETKVATGQPVQVQRMVLTKNRWMNR